MPISARNKLQGRVASIESGKTTSLVTIQSDGLWLVSAITNEGSQELN